jgi:DNA-binding CsgD family transcriptional regulator
MGHIFGKLVARSRAEAINKAVALGLVSPTRS